MKQLLNGWNAMRVIRVLAGLLAAGQGIMLHEWLIMLIGVIFAAMAVANIGCCGPNGCTYTGPVSKQPSSPEEINYEEVNTK